MKGFSGDIEKQTLQNTDFRRVIYTGKHSQLVLMNIPPGNEIGLETHPANDQFLRFELGEGKVIIDGHEYTITAGHAVVVPAGAKHNVVNTSSLKPLKLYTIYSPAHHMDRTVHQTKQDAETSNEEFDGTTSE